ncbi:MAG: twin-arginine translocase subunit TatC [Bryobacteraceae bacterium]|jgi:sec-independent protein translocase protein TatC
MEDDKRGVPPPEGEGSPEDHPRVSETPVPPVEVVTTPTVEVVTETGLIRRPPPPPPPPPVVDPQDEEEDKMLRMSFMEHLEELRSRIIRALYGLGIAFVLSLGFANKLWDFVSDPAIEALKHLHVNPPRLAQLTPMEGFSIIWVELPLLASVFLASPWVVYQLWAFISPGLYKKERRLALPFVLLTAGLFIGGGCFAYFLAFRYGLEFLLGIGMSNNVQPVVSITEYFDLFVNVTLGVALVFELPVLIFLLTLLHLLSPRFLLRHSRYAILAIVIVAAIITPTPDVFNLMLFAVPMCLLYFVGVFAGLALVMRREGRSLPWRRIVWIVVIVLLIAAAVATAMLHFHVHFRPKWPYFTK